ARVPRVEELCSLAPGALAQRAERAGIEVDAVPKDRELAAVVARLEAAGERHRRSIYRRKSTVVTSRSRFRRMASPASWSALLARLLLRAAVNPRLALDPNAHAAELDRWLAAGYAGTMTYLHRQAAKRREPAGILPGAAAAVVTLTNYFHDPAPPARGQPRVAQYAQSADYHRVLGQRLERLAGAIRDLAPGAHTRAYIDAGAVPERELAQRAGLGWIGKN